MSFLLDFVDIPLSLEAHLDWKAHLNRNHKLTNPLVKAVLPAATQAKNIAAGTVKAVIPAATAAGTVKRNVAAGTVKRDLAAGTVEAVQPAASETIAAVPAASETNDAFEFRI